MQAKGLMAATVVLALLTAGVWWSNKDEAAKEEAKQKSGGATAEAPRLLSIPVAELRQVQIENGAAKIVIDRADDGNYTISAPQKLRADIDAAINLFTQFSTLDTQRIVEEKPASLATFGLEPAKMTITATRKSGTAAKLYLGDDSPTGNATYARLDGEQRVVTLGAGVTANLKKTLDDLRDKRLIPFERGSLSRVEIAGKADLAKANDAWRISGASADAAAVDDLLRQLETARMSPTVGAAALAEAAKSWPAAAKLAVVNVTDATGKHTLEVRKSKDGVYLKSPDFENVYTGGTDLATALAKPAADYRNKSVFAFGFDDPTLVEVKATGLNRTLAQTDGKWTESGKPMDAIGAQSLVDKLRELKATSFANLKPGTTELDLTVTSNRGQRKEHVLVWKNGAAYAASRQGEPQAYLIDIASIDALRQAAADVKPAAEPKPAAKK